MSIAPQFDQTPNDPDLFDPRPPAMPTDADLKFDTSNQTEVVKEPPQESYKFYQVENYRPYFDVDTKDVLTRMMKAVVPFGENFIDYVNPTPDLYGPFWIASTVIFLFAAAATASSDNVSIETVSYAAGAIYGYCLFVPLVVWGIGRWWLEIQVSLIEHFCIYGYSFAVYIPACFVLVIPWNWSQWVIMALAGALSTFFLVKTYFKPYSAIWKKGMILLILQAIAHLALALIFKLKIFKSIFEDSTGST